VAKSALRKYRLDKILFVPTGLPPHKIAGKLSEFHHRFAMVALACAGNPRLVPSALEAPDSKPKPNYSIDTVRRLKRLAGPDDEIYFLIGVDAFLDVPQWKQFRRLFDLVNFIVVSRPGFDCHEILKAIPEDLLAKPRPKASSSCVFLRKTVLHILRGVEVPVASREIRRAFRKQERVAGGVPRQVEQYILKEGLYRSRNRLIGGK